MATTWRAKTPIGEDAAQKAYSKNWANMSQSKQETMDKVTAARDEADNEVKRETRGVKKPANFDAIEEAKQEAKDRADAKKQEKAYNESLTTENKRMGGMTKMASGGMTASSRADGCCTKGKTRGKMM
jgi:hypothetical protein